MMKPKRTISEAIVIALFPLISVVNTSCAQPKMEQKDKSDKINEILQTYVNYGHFNGAVLVAEQGEIIYKKGFGLANMEWGIPNQVGTKFKIASMTKPFTAMLIMQLVAEDKLALNEPISTYLPDYPKKNGNLITIHHLLTHSSGLGRHESKNEKKYLRPGLWRVRARNHQ